MAKLRVKLVRSKIGRQERHLKVIEALGLKKIGDEVLVEDNPSMLGMIDKVDFMLEVTEEQ